jgi:hypothetical protein
LDEAAAKSPNVANRVDSLRRLLASSQANDY